MKNGSNRKGVELKLYAPQANKVNVAGDFNRWDIKSVAAKKDLRGSWKARLELSPGRYEYKFIVDGNWHNDPSCKACVPNSFGTTNCVLIVK